MLAHGADARRDVGIGLLEEDLGFDACSRRAEHGLTEAVLTVKQDRQHQSMKMAVEVEHGLPSIAVKVDSGQEAFAPF